MGKRSNAYGEFIRSEFEQAKRSQANFNKSMAQMFTDPVLSDKWTSMAEEDRDYFKRMAEAKNTGTFNPRDFKRQPRQPKKAKLTTNTFCPPPASATRPRATDLKGFIYSKSQEELLERPIYSFSCNVMCADDDDNESYLPLELSIYNYSIKNGETKRLYLAFVNPGQVPPGKMGEAKDHYSESKHAVPFEPLGEFLPYARTDYRQIYEEMLDYVGPDRALVCHHADYMGQTRGVLKWLSKQANKNFVPPMTLPNENDWLLFDMKDYAYMLGKRLNSTLPTEQCIEVLLDSVKFAYVRAFCCDWHSTDENETKWCAKSCSIRSVANLANLFEWFKECHDARRPQESTSRQLVPM